MHKVDPSGWRERGWRRVLASSIPHSWLPQVARTSQGQPTVQGARSAIDCLTIQTARSALDQLFMEPSHREALVS